MTKKFDLENFELLTRQQLAERLGVTMFTIAKWVDSQELPLIKVAGKHYYNWRDIQKWMLSKTVQNKKGGYEQ